MPLDAGQVRDCVGVGVLEVKLAEPMAAVLEVTTEGEILLVIVEKPEEADFAVCGRKAAELVLDVAFGFS